MVKGQIPGGYELLNNSKGKTNPDTVARRWIKFYREKVMPESPCTDVEGLISLFEHDRAHYGKMIATLLPALGMLTGGPLARLLSPDPADIDDLRPCIPTPHYPSPHSKYGVLREIKITLPAFFEDIISW